MWTWRVLTAVLLLIIAGLQNTGSGRSAAHDASAALSVPVVDLQIGALIIPPPPPLTGELTIPAPLKQLAVQLRGDLPLPRSLSAEEALSAAGPALRVRLLSALYGLEDTRAEAILRKAQKAPKPGRRMARILAISLTNINSWSSADAEFMARQKLGPLGLLASARALADNAEMAAADQTRENLKRMGQLARAKSEFSAGITLFLFFAGSAAWLVYFSAGKAAGASALKGLKLPSLPLWKTAAGFLILFLALAGAIALAGNSVNAPWMDDETLSLVHYVAAAVIAVPWAALFLRSRGLSLKDLGLRSSDWVMDIAWGLGGFFAAAILSIIVGLVMIHVSRALGSEGATNPASRYLLISHAGWMTAALIVVFAGVAPLVEELFFRGAILRALHVDYGQQPAIWGSAIAFAIIHPGAPELLVTYVALGWVFAKLTVLRGSLVPSIIAHSLNNLLTASLLLLLQV